MVSYKISLSKLTDKEKEKLKAAISETKKLNVNTSVIIFLMEEMNRMYGKEIYNKSNLSCRDCVNQILNFWRIWNV